jgi:hypothetical protein
MSARVESASVGRFNVGAIAVAVVVALASEVSPGCR